MSILHKDDGSFGQEVGSGLHSRVGRPVNPAPAEIRRSEGPGKNTEVYRCAGRADDAISNDNRICDSLREVETGDDSADIENSLA